MNDITRTMGTRRHPVASLQQQDEQIPTDDQSIQDMSNEREGVNNPGVESPLGQPDESINDTVEAENVVEPIPRGRVAEAAQAFNTTSVQRERPNWGANVLGYTPQHQTPFSNEMSSATTRAQTGGHWVSSQGHLNPVATPFINEGNARDADAMAPTTNSMDRVVGEALNRHDRDSAYKEKKSFLSSVVTAADMQPWVAAWTKINQMAPETTVADAWRYVGLTPKLMIMARAGYDDEKAFITGQVNLKTFLTWLTTTYKLDGYVPQVATYGEHFRRISTKLVGELGKHGVLDHTQAIANYGKDLFDLQEAADGNELLKQEWNRTLETRVDGRGGLLHALFQAAESTGSSAAAKQARGFLSSIMETKTGKDEEQPLYIAKLLHKKQAEFNVYVHALADMQGKTTEEFLQRYQQGTGSSQPKGAGTQKGTSGSTNGYENNRSRKRDSGGQEKSKPKSTSGANQKCKVCGRNHAGDCTRTNHPDANKADVPWDQSESGKRFAAHKDRDGKPIEALPWNKRISKTDPSKLEEWVDPAKRTDNSADKGWKANKRSSKYISISDDEVVDTHSHLLNCEVSEPGVSEEKEPMELSDQEQHVVTPKENTVFQAHDLIQFDAGLIHAEIGGGGVKTTIPVDMLLDTGANPFNFCSYRIEELLKNEGASFTPQVARVAVGNKKKLKTKGFFSVSINLINKISFLTEKMLSVRVYVLDIPYDIIIGRSTIKQHPQLKQLLFHDLFTHDDFDTWLVPLLQSLKRDSVPLPEWTPAMKAQEVNEHLRMWEQRKKEEEAEKAKYREVKLQYAELLNKHYPLKGAEDESQRAKKRRLNHRNSATVHREIHSLLAIQAGTQRDPSHDGTPVPEGESTDPLDIPTHIEGSDSLKAKQVRLVTMYKDQFSTALRPEAADVPAMVLEVSPDWECGENRRSPRPQGPVREGEINAQTVKMKDANVIRLSRAAAHSQVLLTPKPDGTWRFCVDYRRLNDKTRSETWPIPNIPEMLARLGSKRPTVFGVIDLTKGYYQAPLSESSKHYTAFVTSCALYEWNRVPMGLMGAPSYFQRIMSTIVLAGLMYKSCEVYMDDIIVYGRTEEEYLRNLEEVLKRLKKHRLTANPKKTKLGLKSIEYVGYRIDHEKVEFDPMRLKKIIEFPEPKTLGHLKKFMGMASYVRDTVRNAAEYTIPLTELFKGYSKKRKNVQIQWTPELRDALAKVKEGINNSQPLFFIDHSGKSPIHLFTDASQFGIGAWLCQDVGGERRTIAIMSKTLTKSQRNWHIPEKEAYAIVVALEKFNYLIRDTRFTLHTDHANLIYIRDTGSPKVVNWKCKVQEHDFDVQFVKGEDNLVADQLSRNECAEECEEEEDPYTVTELANLDLGENHHMQAELMCIHKAVAHTSLTTAQREVMKSVHNEVAGHNGVESTLEKLRKGGHDWKYMREHVERYIHECDTCQKRDTRTRKYDVRKFTTGTTRLMRNRSIDTVGPFQTDSDGNTHLAVVIDTFSRWVELYPIKGNTALSAADALYANYGRFGAPEELKSDNGSEFVNDLVKQFNTRVGTTQHFTIPYSHEENGIVERSNREIRKFINDICYDKRLAKSAWSKDIPAVMRILNTSRKTMTGMSPSYMLYAGSIDLDAQLFKSNWNTSQMNQLEDDALLPWQDWLAQRHLAQTVAMAHARKRTNEHHDSEMAKDTGKRTEFKVGSLVLKRHPTSTYGSGAPSKQDALWTGPYKVERFTQETYYLVDQVNGKFLSPCNIQLLKPYEYDPATTDPFKIRLKDFEDQYEVEAVEAHFGNFGKKKRLKFGVRWRGYAETTLEPWANVRDNACLHAYLRRIGESKHIPAKFASLAPE